MLNILIWNTKIISFNDIKIE